MKKAVMKYIPADELTKKFEKMIDNIPASVDSGAVYVIDEVYKIINSLQQEQPDGYNLAMLEVKAKVDKLYDEISIGLNEYDAGLYNGIAETCMKLRGFIIARISSQEHPEVDIEKEIEARAECVSVCYFCRERDYLERIEWCKEQFRYFYTLGLNSKK